MWGFHHGLLRRLALGDHQLGNLDAGAGTLAGDTPQLELIVGAVDGPQPFVDVAQADAVAGRVFQALFADPEPVVGHLDDRAAVAQHAPDRDASLADLA